MKLITLHLGEDRRLPKGFYVVAHTVISTGSFYWIGRGAGKVFIPHSAVLVRLSDGKADSMTKVRRILNAAFAEAGRAKPATKAK